MQLFNSKSLIFFALCVTLVGLAGCSFTSKGDTPKKTKSQFEALLQDLKNWDNTKQRIEKRHKGIVLLVKKYYEDFQQLSEDEKLKQYKDYLRRVDELLKLLPDEAHTIKMEARTVVYARRYCVAIRNIIEATGAKKADVVNAQQREVVDGWLGYSDAYNSYGDNKYFAKLTKEALGKLKLGQSYYEMANILQLPGEKAAVYVPVSPNNALQNEINVWIEGDSYLLVRYQNGKAVEIIPKVVEKTESNALNVANPLKILQAKLEIEKFEKKIVKPAKDAYENFHKEYGAFCKGNKDGNVRNKKRVDLAKKYYEIIKSINVNIISKEDDKLFLTKQKGLDLKKYIEAYLEANSKILDTSAVVRSKAWRDNNIFYRKSFDTQLEYNYLKNVNLLKDELYIIRARGSWWLKNGHSYFNFSNVYKIPGKLLRSEMIKNGKKNIHQEIYLWSVSDTYCLVTFHNGRAVNIRKMGAW